MSNDHPTSPAAVVVTPDDVEVLALPGAAFGLLDDASASRGALGVNTLRLDTGADGAEPHHHARSWEVFYVLEGRAELLLGDKVRTVERGGLVMVPPGLPHAFGAAPGFSAELLVVLTPGVQRFDYFRHLHRVALAGEPPQSLSPEDQALYDVHFVDHPDWEAARRPVRAARAG